MVSAHIAKRIKWWLPSAALGRTYRNHSRCVKSFKVHQTCGKFSGCIAFHTFEMLRPRFRTRAKLADTPAWRRHQRARATHGAGRSGSSKTVPRLGASYIINLRRMSAGAQQKRCSEAFDLKGLGFMLSISSDSSNFSEFGCFCCTENTHTHTFFHPAKSSRYCKLYLKKTVLKMPNGLPPPESCDASNRSL